MVDLFNAKCEDLKISQSREQMFRFFEVFSKNQAAKEKRLNLSDLSLGINSTRVICQILKNNTHFSSLVRV
jgi:hypothetical protein